MMKKVALLFVFCAATLFAMADEGMWFLMHIKRLNEADMQKKGLQLTAEEIYSINHSSLKDAIVQFNGGCTAEIVSDRKSTRLNSSHVKTSYAVFCLKKKKKKTK